MVSKTVHMSLCNYITPVSIMAGLIQAKTTGPVRQFAKTMQLAEPRLHRHIKTMKQMGFPVKYSQRYNSYCYTN